MNQRLCILPAFGSPWRTVLLCSAVLASTPLASAAGRLNDTGQTRCVVVGQYSDCGGTGQDAEFGRDVSAPKNEDGLAGFSFQKVCNNGDVAGAGTCPADPPLGPNADEWACTRDKVTGLIWEVKTADGGLRDQSHLYTQKIAGKAGSALAFVNAVNGAGLCGAQDWRLPSAAELAGLVDHGIAPLGAMIDTNWFPNTPSGAGGTWAAEGLATDPTQAWLVNFDDGVSAYAKRKVLRSARLVRGAPQSASLVAAGEEVTDRATGLVWRRCSEGQTWDGSTCAGEPMGLQWTEALSWSVAEAARTGMAWRLPNAKELASIADRSVARPSISRKAFPNTPRTAWYWTSTPGARDPAYAWIVSFEIGFVAPLNYPTYVFDLRLVRDAP